jgi:hypothetical protein
MGIPRIASLVALLGMMLGSLSAVGGCASTLEPRDGNCAVVSSALLDCSVDATDAGIDVLANVPKLAAYACTGTVRPDEGAVMNEGVPKGRVCADRGLIGDTKQRGYCCTDDNTTCAYNPTADCKDPRYGFQCRGSLRPEMYNASIYCDQAVRSEQLVNYCCADRRLTWGCRPSNGCPKYLASWNCDEDILPRSQELTVSKSRADTYYMTCATPKSNLDGTKNYCCYTPSIIPEGGTCTEDTRVPGCDTRRFGFACIGPDLPTDSFLPMSCLEPGFPGISMQGYAATLYCCDFVIPQCLADSDCTNPARSKCNVVSGECGPCQSDLDCSSNPARPTCVAGKCV